MDTFFNHYDKLAETVKGRLFIVLGIIAYTVGATALFTFLGVAHYGSDGMGLDILFGFLMACFASVFLLFILSGIFRLVEWIKEGY